MGVPVFFKWLSVRNPKLIKDAIQPQSQHSDQPSQNPYVDNFYIDMNGLIHPSANPRGEKIRIPTNFQQQCQNIYEYIDILMKIVRPRKTLYLAIDGCAPRAKMNQQRSRRFRAALEGEQNAKKKKQLLQKFKKLGAWNQQLQQYASKKKFDSNTITPGTEFLSTLCVQLRKYIKKRLENHPLWKNLIVVFSDANCPGQGQHKIMDFIRQERCSAQYSPDQSHCIYGADADLIMLSLATHEPKFYIIREIVITQNDKFCTNCQRRGHYFMSCNQQANNDAPTRMASQNVNKLVDVKFQFIRIQMVRQYIHINYMRSIIPFGYDLQRIIDDFIFLCFFVGNDFLPHIPCLSIREGGIDVLMKVYEYCLSIMPDYITNAGQLNIKSLKIFVEQMKNYENPLVREMVIRQSNTKQRQINNRNFQQKQKAARGQKPNQNEWQDEIDLINPLNSFKQMMQKISRQEQGFNLDDYSVFNHNVFNYKQKYYREKFKITPGEFLQLKSNVSRSYIQALKWICAYYYKGVPSWSWFYPFHYSPFFTDMIIPDQDIQEFEKGSPFRPFQQLMAVLPARTCDALPKFLHYFMKDVTSPIIDYYPSDFHIDLVGKKFAWLGEVILPFIDDKRLLSAINGYQQKLSKQQSHRNRFGTINMYISKNGPLGRKIKNQVKKGKIVNFSWQNGHQIEGAFTLLQEDDNFISFDFDQPQGRIHKIALIQGTNNNPLQQIDDNFISRTDKAAFGGLRYARVVDNVLSERKYTLQLRRSQSGNAQQDNEDRNDSNTNWKNRRDDRQRSRSRDKNRNYQRNYYQNNQNNNDGRNRYNREYNNNYNNNYNNSNRQGRQYRGQNNNNRQYNRQHQDRSFQRRDYHRDNNNNEDDNRDNNRDNNNRDSRDNNRDNRSERRHYDNKNNNYYRNNNNNYQNNYKNNNNNNNS